MSQRAPAESTSAKRARPERSEDGLPPRWSYPEGTGGAEEACKRLRPSSSGVEGRGCEGPGRQAPHGSTPVSLEEETGEAPAKPAVNLPAATQVEFLLDVVRRLRGLQRCSDAVPQEARAQLQEGRGPSLPGPPQGAATTPPPPAALQPQPSSCQDLFTTLTALVPPARKREISQQLQPQQQQLEPPQQAQQAPSPLRRQPSPTSQRQQAQRGDSALCAVLIYQLAEHLSNNESLAAQLLHALRVVRLQKVAAAQAAAQAAATCQPQTTAAGQVRERATCSVSLGMLRMISGKLSSASMPSDSPLHAAKSMPLPRRQPSQPAPALPTEPAAAVALAARWDVKQQQQPRERHGTEHLLKRLGMRDSHQVLLTSPFERASSILSDPSHGSHSHPSCEQQPVMAAAGQASPASGNEPPSRQEPCFAAPPCKDASDSEHTVRGLLEAWRGSSTSLHPRAGPSLPSARAFTSPPVGPMLAAAPKHPVPAPPPLPPSQPQQQQEQQQQAVPKSPAGLQQQLREGVGEATSNLLIRLLAAQAGTKQQQAVSTVPKAGALHVQPQVGPGDTLDQKRQEGPALARGQDMQAVQAYAQSQQITVGQLAAGLLLKQQVALLRAASTGAGSNGGPKQTGQE